MSEFLATRWVVVFLDATAKTLVLFLAAGTAVLLLRRASAAARHLVWLLTLGGALVLPLLSTVVPGWRVALWPAGLPVLSDGRVSPGLRLDPSDQTDRRMVVQKRSAAGSTARDRAALRQEEAVGITAPAELFVRSSVTHRVAAVGPGRGAAPQRPPSTLPASRVWPPESASSLLAWIFLLWLAIGAAVLARALAGLAQLWRIGRRCRQVTAAPVLSLAADLARDLGVTRPVLLLHGLLDGPPAMPMTWGFLRPIVLLPTGFAGWPEHRQRAVLLHELAHVKRADWLAQILAQMTCAVYWFHPLAWWAARRLRVESERACDDRVLTAGIKPSDYATHLLEVVRMLKATRVSLRAAVTMAHRPLIEERLRAILDTRRSRGSLPERASALAVAGAVALLLPLAVIRVAAKTPAARAVPKVSRATLLPAAIAGSERTVASVEITPRMERSATPTPSPTIRSAQETLGEPEVEDQQPASEPAAFSRPVVEKPADSAATAPSPAAHPAAARTGEYPQEVRAAHTVLAVDAEVRSKVVLAGAVSAGELFFAADADDDRSEAKSKEPNLADKDLSGADLSGRDLSGKDLSGKDLSGANLSGAKLRDANLSKTDLSGANLTNVDLSHAKVKGADMSGVNLTGANLSGVDLSGVDLSGANLSKVNSSDLTLAHADLSGANLKGINLSGRDLSGADFSGADLSGARLSDANLTKADLSGANLGDADLSHARLKDADLSGANLNGTNVRDADLSGADVSGTKLDKSKPE